MMVIMLYKYVPNRTWCNQPNFATLCYAPLNFMLEMVSIKMMTWTHAIQVDGLMDGEIHYGWRYNHDYTLDMPQFSTGFQDYDDNFVT